MEVLSRAAELLDRFLCSLFATFTRLGQARQDRTLSFGTASWLRSRLCFSTEPTYFTNESTRNSTVADVARKVMGDAPIAYVEGAGGTRVAEDQIVAPEKSRHVSAAMIAMLTPKPQILSFKVGR